MRFCAVKSYWSYRRGHRMGMIFTGLLYAFATVPLAWVPFFLGQLTDRIAADQLDPRSVVTAAVVLVGCGVVHQCLWLSADWSWRYTLLPQLRNYETHLFQRVGQEDYSYFVARSTGKISASITMLRDQLKAIAEAVFKGFIPHLVGVSATIVLLSLANWQSLVVYLVSVVAMFAVGRVLIAPAIRRQAALTDAIAGKTGVVIDSVANFAAVRSFRTLWHEVRVLDATQQRVIRSALNSYDAWYWFWAVFGMIVRLLTWPTLVALNVWLFLRGDIDIATATMAITAALLFTNDVWEMIDNVAGFSSMVSAADESYSYLLGDQILTPQALQTSPPDREVPSKAGVAVTGVTFAYPDKPEQDVLHGIDLTVLPGERIGLVGPSGGGKTTLIKLMLGFYQPTVGQVTPISDGQVADVSDLCTYVPQDTAMFNRTVAENIGYAAADASSKSDIHRAATLACADEFIRGLPDGYATLVGERGVKLSGGQRQRIAIARAIVHDMPVLILDEATSALDSESERYVQEALDNLWQGRTVIAIAHRLSTLRSMDRIVVLDAGRIVEQGSPEELLRQDGLYSRLWRQQTDGFIATS